MLCSGTCKRFLSRFVDPPCKYSRFREAERGFLGMCAGLRCRNQGLVLWGCGAEATALVPAFPCCAPRCRHAPYALSVLTESETLEI